MLGITRKVLEVEESVIRSCQVLSSINPKHVYGITQYETVLATLTFLIFLMGKQLQAITSGFFMGRKTDIKKGDFEEVKASGNCSLSTSSTLYLLCDFRKVRQPL